MIDDYIKTKILILIKTFHHILYFLAGFILLLHNITPHLHHGEMGLVESKEVQGTSSPIEWLLSGSHNDLGDNHLECFSEISISDFSVVAQPVVAKDALPAISSLFSFGYQPNISIASLAGKVCFEEKTAPSSPFYLSDAPLRAPPFCA